jgi:hypothetical protein
MNFVRLLPVVVSFLLLAAHFYRAGMPWLTVLCLALPLLLIPKDARLPRLFQVLLALGALEWLRTLYALAGIRLAFGQPWGRLALILGGVAVFTLASGLVFRSRELKRRYDKDQLGESGFINKI